MSHFTEDPTFVIICGTIISLALLVGLIKTGRVLFIVWLALAVILTVGLVFLERIIVTDREKIEIVLADGANALSQNNIPRAISLISPSQAKIAASVQNQTKRIKFSECYIITQNIELEKLNPPSHGVAVITGKIAVEGAFPYSGPIKVKLDFVREGEKWLIEDYEVLR